MRAIPALTAAAVAAAVLPALPAGAAPPDPSPTGAGSFCTTRVLAPHQLRAGQRSAVRCFASAAEQRAATGFAPGDPQLPPGEVGDGTAARLAPGDRGEATAQLQADGQVIWAVHYDGFNGVGAALTVTGPPACDGSGLSFGAGQPWNDAISSTRHYLCGTIKHWQHAGRQGAQQVTNGVAGQLVNMVPALSNQVSSTSYIP